MVTVGPASLAALATGRQHSMFANDMAAHAAELRERLCQTRILAVGGAGSIGASTIGVIAGFAPAALHVVDQNENALAELVRALRSGTRDFTVPDFRAMPVDYGSATMQRLLAAEGPYDLVLNFAAIKHVRSEKDAYSVLQMLDTNVVKLARLLSRLSETMPAARVFSVSTDKAANPASLMGATKRLMEHVLFAGAPGHASSARFANVAFSNGSLLQAFENRFARAEPIACPEGISRYFVSLEEAGEICTLAACLVGDRQIAVPNLDPQTCLAPMRGIAEAFIRHQGFEPQVFRDETEARRACAETLAAGRWPLLLTPADTAGEKPYEEFVANGEDIRPTGLAGLSAVPWAGPSREAIVTLVAALEHLVTDPRASADHETIMALIASVEPAFAATHRASPLGLDQRM